MGLLQPWEGAKQVTGSLERRGKEGQAGSLTCSENGCVQGPHQSRGLDSWPTPLVVSSAGGICNTLLLLPTPCCCPQLFRSNSWSFGSFCFLLSRICLSWACAQLFLVPYSFFVFCCSRRHLSRCMASQVVLMVKNLAANAGECGFDPWSGRSSGGGPGNPLQCSCLESLMDREARWATVLRVAKCQTQLKRLSTHSHRTQNPMWTAMSKRTDEDPMPS